MANYWDNPNNICIDEVTDNQLYFETLKAITLGYDLTNTTTPTEGQTNWNSTDGALQTGLAGGNVVLQHGMEVVVPRRVKNTSGADIANGDLVYITGGSGNNAYIAKADASTHATSCGTIAMATEDIDDNAFGWCTTFGLVRGSEAQPIDTSSYSAGDVLFLSTTAGAFTDTMPVHPNYVVRCGFVFRSHATEGVILVRIDDATSATCIAGGDTIVYDDIQVGISNIRIPPSSAPTERLYNGGIGGGVTFPFLGFAVNDYLYFDMQTPHSALINSILESHIHYTTPGNGTGDKFKFQLDLIACPIGGNWAVPTGSPFTAERTMDSDDSNSQMYFDIADIPAVNSTVSTLYKCKLTRIAASADEYAGEVYVSFLDGHYQKDSLGSRNETSKG